MPTFLGRNVVTMPASPAFPSRLEIVDNAITAETAGTFSGNLQVFDYNARWLELSVSMQSMPLADGQIWAAFLRSCHGQACVFTFPAAACAVFPVELTTDGTTPRYFGLQANRPHWTIKEGQIYGVTFEVREAT